MRPSDDPYEVLQVDPRAEPEVVRAAYRALALKYHPDVSTGSQERMAALNEAWRILRDPVARTALDEARAGSRATREAPKPEAAFTMPAPQPATPPGRRSGSVLDFGRYAGWSLGQIAAHDPEYLEWLARTTIGRAFSHEIERVLATRTVAGAAAAGPIAGRRQRQFART